jgi:predicted amidohydrolase
MTFQTHSVPAQDVAARRRLGVAGVQMAVTAGESNLPRMQRLIADIKARFPWVDLILFPELCVFGPDPRFAEPMPGQTTAQLSGLAAQHKLWLAAGSMFEQDGSAVFNSAPVFAPDGKMVAKHRKLFPFLPYETGVMAGTISTLFDLPGLGRAGLSICYDMWFPETTRTLAARGAEIVLHPTLTDTIDRDVELAIARASAAMNQCWFFDINGVGDGGVGRSIVVDPAGYVLHEAGHSQEIIPIMVDLDRVRLEREEGIRGLGQPLKSFRDRSIDFDIYDRARADTSYLASLGPLAKPRSPNEARPQPASIGGDPHAAFEPGGTGKGT